MVADGRLLQVLAALNEIGPSTVIDLHQKTKISRSAIYRVLESLCRAGFVRQIPGDSRYRLTHRVLSLSAGFSDYDRLTEAGGAAIAELQEFVRWPTSFAMPQHNVMVVWETTRFRSPFVFDNGAVGLRLPILHSSLGLAYLAFASPARRRTILSAIRGFEYGEEIGLSLERVERLLGVTASRGFGFRCGGIETRTSSIAVPVIHEGAAHAAMCVTYATAALRHSDAINQFLPHLKKAASDTIACLFKGSTPPGETDLAGRLGDQVSVRSMELDLASADSQLSF